MNKCIGLPLAGGDRLDQPLASFDPSVKSGQIGFETCFIEKYETFGIDIPLSFLPVFSF